jgi:flagellar basal body-associated protein FliL
LRTTVDHRHHRYRGPSAAALLLLLLLLVLLLVLVLVLVLVVVVLPAVASSCHRCTSGSAARKESSGLRTAPPPSLSTCV